MTELPPPLQSNRLDRYLAEQLGKPRHQLQKLIKQGDVLVNNKPGKSSQLISRQDRIFIKESNTPLKTLTSDIVVPMLYEDADILMINKPAGLTVHPGNGPREFTLVDALLAYGCTLSTVGGEERPGIVHRLDKDTEGLMIIAKNNEAHLHLTDQFKAKTVTKKYYAMVKGNITNDDMKLDFPIGRHPQHRTKMAVLLHDSMAREALTYIRVLARFNTKTLIEAMPVTGRTHQIRVHLAHVQHPLIGDFTYGGLASSTGQFLQSFFISFIHPTQKNGRSFQLPLSDRFGLSGSDFTD